jgi:hypothetical protein
MLLDSGYHLIAGSITMFMIVFGIPVTAVTAYVTCKEILRWGRRKDSVKDPSKSLTGD